mgnify:CR=1 FL=1
MSATYPLEVVRSRLSVGPALGIEYKGIVDCARKTIAAEGIGGLYRGYMVGLTTGAPYVGLQMTIYDILKRYAPKREDGGTDVVYKAELVAPLLVHHAHDGLGDLTLDLIEIRSLEATPWVP